MSIFLYADMAIRAAIGYQIIKRTPVVRDLPMTTKLGLSILSYPLSSMLGLSMSAKDYQNSSISSVCGAVYNRASYACSAVMPSNLTSYAYSAAQSPFQAASYGAKAVVNHLFPYEHVLSNVGHLAYKYAPAAAIIGAEYFLLKDALEFKKQLGIYGVRSNFAHGAANISIAACALPMATACLLPFGAAAGVALISYGVHVLSDMVTTAYVRAAQQERARVRD